MLRIVFRILNSLSIILLFILGFLISNAKSIDWFNEDLNTRNWTKVSPKHITIDDYAGVSLPDRQWYYSRIGTDRGVMGDGKYEIRLGGGTAYVKVRNGWAGVWTSLMHNERDADTLSPAKLLGPYVKKKFQPYITGLQIELVDGYGSLKVELKNAKGQIVHQEKRNLSGASRVLNFSISPHAEIKLLNWLVDGSGFAKVKNARLKIKSPKYLMPEAVFLFSYGHLSQCYDPDMGLVRDRARWPSKDYAALPSTGMFALATAIAHDLGYVGKTNAKKIVKKIRNVLQKLPRYHGLLPHFVTNKKITPETEWSSVDTVITLTSVILACQSLRLNSSPLEEMILNIDWFDLTDGGAHSISQGYDYESNKIKYSWDTFGSEAFIIAVAFAAATGGQIARLDLHSEPPTWDGSGFNDELAALFFPMNGIDAWGNDWSIYRKQAYRKQKDYFLDHYYHPKSLFGLSACEVPEPWRVLEEQVYSAWGVGGHNGEANDGSSLVGYPIIAPHYPAMLAAEQPVSFERLFKYLILKKKILTPLNNVESFGIDAKNQLRWNSLKGSWNLSLQSLGISRALSGSKYLPYRSLKKNKFLKEGFESIFVKKME